MKPPSLDELSVEDIKNTRSYFTKATHIGVKNYHEFQDNMSVILDLYHHIKGNKVIEIFKPFKNFKKMDRTLNMMKNGSIGRCQYETMSIFCSYVLAEDIIAN